MSLITKTTVPTLAARLSKVHVLIVDDDSEIINLLRGILMKLGFEHITACRDGSDAISMFRNNLFDREVDLVITDWNMTPMNGLDFVRYIRSSPDSPNKFLPIVMLSGRSEWTDVEKARDAGFSEYLVKPFTAKSLCDRIILCIEAPREFVSSGTYKGPSRRRKSATLPPGVEKDRRQRDAVNTLPGKALKSKIGFDINARQIFTKENIQGAQEFINDTAEAFQQWVMKDISQLMHLYRNACQVENPKKYYKPIQNIAFSIKSHAGTFGYDLASLVAKSLYAACERPLADSKLQLLVIEKHIKTLHTIFKGDIQGDGGAIANELLEGLEAMILKYKKQIRND